MGNIIQEISLSSIVGLMVKASLVVLTLLSLVMVRQAGLMDKVVAVSVGNWFKMVAWGFFLVSLILTLGIILVV